MVIKKKKSRHISEQTMFGPAKLNKAYLIQLITDECELAWVEKYTLRITEVN
jgi:hypothetical protein